MLLLMVTTIGMSFSLQAQFAELPALDVALRVVLAAIAMVVLVHPDRQVAVAACVPVGLFVAYWWLKRRKAPARAAAA
jgi:hypothetical protein